MQLKQKLLETGGNISYNAVRISNYQSQLFPFIKSYFTFFASLYMFDFNHPLGWYIEFEYHRNNRISCYSQCGGDYVTHKSFIVVTDHMWIIFLFLTKTSKTTFIPFHPDAGHFIQCTEFIEWWIEEKKENSKNEVLVYLESKVIFFLGYFLVPWQTVFQFWF